MTGVWRGRGRGRVLVRAQVSIFPFSPFLLPFFHRPPASHSPTLPCPPPSPAPGQSHQTPTLLSSSPPSSTPLCSFAFFSSHLFLPFLETAMAIAMAIAHQRQSPLANQLSPLSQNYSHHSPLPAEFAPALFSAHGHVSSFPDLEWQYRWMTMMAEMTGGQSSIEVRRSPRTRRGKLLGPLHSHFPV